VHPTAIVDPGARLHETVEVGPYTVIGPGVEIGEGTVVASHVVLKGPMRIGRRNRIYSFACLGEVSQDKTAKPEDATSVVIGDDNTIREYVTIQRGTLKTLDLNNGETRVGNDNWIMAYCHIAHDCIIGDHTIFANGTTLAGHVTVEDHVVFGGATLIAQYLTLGAHSFTAGGAGITTDVPPFVIVQGNPAEARGINVVGIRRRDFTAEQHAEIKQAYRILFVAEQTWAEAKAELAELAKTSEPARQMHEFIERSKRPLRK
jgi:UDP-N-acetylglucosamine acyltransferase